MMIVTRAASRAIRRSAARSTAKRQNTEPRYRGLRSRTFNPGRSMSTDSVTSGLDAYQVALLEEPCILIDKDDQPQGSASKKTCHLLQNINQGMLHRAFSVFLFNTKGELLLQQRSNTKITFPGHWTNTCCSHPLHVENEMVEEGALGVKRAAQRKLKHELGIQPGQVPLEAFQYLTRIHYKSPNMPHDGRWGEHEIDYILFIQKDVDVVINSNEVSACQYVTRDHLRSIITESERNGTLITPWFRLIVDKFLFKWWDQLQNLQQCEDQQTIHRMC